MSARSETILTPGSVHTRQVHPFIPGARRGFTLLEVLVAVAAVAIVAAGLAAVFDSVGKTVTAGRRVSRVNQYGRLLEQQLRRDFQQMSRQGFLVVRQQFADTNADGVFDPAVDIVPLYEDQPRVNDDDQSSDEWRRRRVDEILFFAEGQFRSARTPIGVSGWEQPSSDEAMIYYGHGMRMSPDASDEFRSPRVNETNTSVRNGTPTVLGFYQNNAPDADVNPNVYASSWILLRKQTVLVPSSPTQRVRPALPEFGGANQADAILADKEMQVAGQPALATVFRSVNALFKPGFQAGDPPFGNENDYFWLSSAGSVPSDQANYDDANAMPGPTLVSGTVDIATTTLEEIRRFVYGYCDVTSGTPLTRLPGAFDASGLASPRAVVPQAVDAFGARSGGFAWLYNTPDQRPAYPGGWESLDYIHAWMDSAMPGRASAHGGPGNQTVEGGFDPAYDYADSERGIRIRAEEFAPGLAESLTSVQAASPDERRRQLMSRGDRLALGASNLVIGCSEFAIDWSYGIVADGGGIVGGNVLWHGPETACGFFEGNPTLGGACAYGFNSPVVVGVPSDSNPQVLAGTQEAGYPRTPRLIYGYNPNSLVDASRGEFPLSVSSFFGDVDPTYTRDLDGDGLVEADGEIVSPATRAWTWPTLIRVRVTIADPVDPRIEQTFEYVFDVPQRGQ